MEVMCRGPGMNGTITTNIEQESTRGDSAWGSWSTGCPPGTAVCALKTRVHVGGGSWWSGSDCTDCSNDDAVTIKLHSLSSYSWLSVLHLST